MLFGVLTFIFVTGYGDLGVFAKTFESKLIEYVPYYKSIFSILLRKQLSVLP